MSARWAPHWQLLSADWRMNGRWSAFRLLTIGLLVTGMACLAGTMGWTPKPAFRFLFAFLSVVSLAFLWLLYAFTLIRFNHPVDARLVPRQLQCLRTILLGMWLTFTAAAGGAVVQAAGLPFVSSLLTFLLFAAGALLPLLLMRWPPLLALLVLLWLATSFLGGVAALQSIGSVLYDVMQQVFLLPVWCISLATLIAMSALARLLTHGVLRAGGDAHAARFRVNRFVLGEAQMATTSELKLGLFGVVPRLGRRQLALLSTTPGTSVSVFQRIMDLRFNTAASWHWLLLYAVVVLIACSGLWFASAHTETLVLGFACVWTVIVPLTTRATLMARSAKEQALWMLLPGMPQGAAINRALAKCFLKESLLTWGGVAVLSMAPRMFQPMTFDWDGMGLSLVVIGLLPSLAFAVEDWSRLRLNLTATQSLGNTLWLLVSPSLCITAFAMGAPVWLLALGSVLATVVMVGWRWRQLDHYPAALPAGRF